MRPDGHHLVGVDVGEVLAFESRQHFCDVVGAEEVLVLPRPLEQVMEGLVDNPRDHLRLFSVFQRPSNGVSPPLLPPARGAQLVLAGWGRQLHEHILIGELSHAAPIPLQGALLLLLQ
jgi:hypothetical protein